MNNKNIEKLIKESLKDIALRIYDMNYADSKSLIAEYNEWIIEELNIDEIMMLPYEAYTNYVEEKLKEE